MKIYKFLGKRGSITIPYEIRIKMGFEPDDVLSFEAHDDGTVIIRKESLCCGYRQDEQTNAICLQDLLDKLPVAAKRDVLVYLSMQLALERQRKGDCQ